MAKRKTRTFVKTIDDREVVQVAHTPGDAVALTFNGWREVLDEAPTTTTTASTSTSASAPKKAAAARAAAADKPTK